ncbi:MAG: hypothetical protein AB1348_03240 [Nitrospirota bacterium]
MKVLSCLFLLVLFLVFPCYSAFSQTTNLSKGIEDYKDENFEEALESFIKAREEDPSSSVAAFYLGLTYKQLLNYKEAAVNFRDAVTLGVVSYEFYKGANFIVQYAHIRDDSNIPVYDYERNIYSAGIEYRF